MYSVTVKVITLMHYMMSAMLWFGNGQDNTVHIIYITPNLKEMPCPDHSHLCLTLSEFANSSSGNQSLNWNVQLILLPGEHDLGYSIVVRNGGMFAMHSSSQYILPQITCQVNMTRFHFQELNQVWIKGLKFIGCGNNTAASIIDLTIENTVFLGYNESGTPLILNQTNATIFNTIFDSNIVGTALPHPDSFSYVGGAIIVDSSNMEVRDCLFVRNYAKNFGGAIFSQNYANITLTNTTFNNNSVCNDSEYSCKGGALYLCSKHNRTKLSVVKSQFVFNTAVTGSVLYAGDSDISIHFSYFDSNANFVLLNGLNGALKGILHMRGNVHLTVEHSVFCNNSGVSGHVNSVLFLITGTSRIVMEYSHFHNNKGWFGSAVTAAGGTITFKRCTFANNTAFQGGILYAQQCKVNIQECQFDDNYVLGGNFPAGGVLIGEDSYITVSMTNFSNNTAEDGTGGVLALANNVTLTVDTCMFVDNRAKIGGVLYIKQSTVVFQGASHMTGNHAVNGGAIAAFEESVLYVYNKLVITNNTANHTGGGAYLIHSTLKCERNCTLQYKHNKAGNEGGGIHASNSFVSISVNRESLTNPCSISFIENDAKQGGGIFLVLYSMLYIKKSGFIFTEIQHSLNFTANTADYGAALYVDDQTLGTCYVPSECFIQVLSTEATRSHTYGVESIEFVGNSARKVGSVLYGGLLDRCTLQSTAEIKVANLHRGVVIDGITFFKNVSNMSENNGSIIASHPVRVCLCDLDGHPDCSVNTIPTIEVKKGEYFSIPLSAVDQVDQTLSNLTIYAQLKHSESGLGVAQLAQIIRGNCSNLTFNIYSPHSVEEITLYADGPCRNAKKSSLKLPVAFKNCTCPVGFCPRKLEIEDNCVCSCDPQLLPYIKSCDSKAHTLTRRGYSWISYFNTTNDTNQYNYLTYDFCPLDYCVPPDINVEINLNVKDGADVQCQNNRSGLLCGVCPPGLTVSLGTSRCISCNGGHDLWWLVLIFVTAGVALVTVFLALNITVAVGTINGVVFYANIIGGTHSTFFSTTSTKSAYIIVSWLNLDLGFDACFVDGLDTYMKTWIQMAFPTYIIVLLIIMIVWSEHSLKFSNLIGRKNPVALLATLIFLSYTKFLLTAITALLFVTLEYPDGSHKVFWLPDASVDYFSAKHLALVVVAIVILLVGTVYTILLLFWQWIRRWITSKVSHKVYHFFDMYQVPYNLQHRFWPGLLLLVRVILYLLFALNQSGDPRVNLIGIIIVMCSLLLLKGVCGCVYKNKVIDFLEFASYMNIVTFSAVQFYTLQSDKSQTISALISVSITAVMCVVILSYHISSTAFVQKLWLKYTIKSRQHSQHSPVVQNRHRANEMRPYYDSIEDNSVITTSVVEFPGTESHNEDGENAQQIDTLNSESGDSCDGYDSSKPLLS